MLNNKLSLFIEIDNSNFSFFVTENSDKDHPKPKYELKIPAIGFKDAFVLDFENVYNTIKEKTYFIEQELNFTFKEVILILENFYPTFINTSGYKKLNGSQISRENITYILNTIKSNVDESEKKKTIIHIFNSNFLLDKKKTENLPIGLFGDFYSHELSLSLIDNNNFKNLQNIFDKCNLKIKKTFLKSFIQGAYISNCNRNTETFFYIEINQYESKIFYFENNSLKFEQEFNFGNVIVLNDVSKVTGLNIEIVKNILSKIELENEKLNDNFIEKEFFKETNYRNIKKSLIYKIIIARIEEISDLMLFKNINLKYYCQPSAKIFLKLKKETQFNNLEHIYMRMFTKNKNYNVSCLNEEPYEKMIETANHIVHFGWKKEAIPISKAKKSLIVRFFEAIFD